MKHHALTALGLVLALVFSTPVMATAAPLPDKALVVDGILLINRTYPIGPDYDPIPNAPDNKQLLPEAQKAFNEMRSAAQREAGLNLFVLSGYRNYAYQQWLYNSYRANVGDYADTFSAKPGMSEHQSGLAADIGDLRYPGATLEVSFENTDAGRWLAANAPRFGFILRFPKGQEGVTGYQYEPWHFRYVGRETAQRMTAAGVPTLEAWLGTDPSAGRAVGYHKIGNVLVNRLPAPLGGYLIKGYHYYKLRDLAQALSGTAAAFSVDYDADSREIILQRTPFASSEEKIAGETGMPCRSALMDDIRVRVDGGAFSLSRAVIDDFSYIKLRDLAGPLGFKVDWQEAPPTVLLTTPEKPLAEPDNQFVGQGEQGPSESAAPVEAPATSEPAPSAGPTVG
ncbi:MAG: D-alanyl-D-alanine carboxypeptidase family protein [Clostridiales bacterium]|nr:D-alanyl-D-alanine carboxypeptidase family protein [Clostridiales bacterium]